MMELKSQQSENILFENFIDGPTDYEYAVLSAVVYCSKEQQENPEKFQQENIRLKWWSDLKRQGWSLYQFYEGKMGYRGVAYIHTRRKQVVIAHRGTVPDELQASLTTLFTDLRSVVQGRIGDQQAHAYEFIHSVLTQCDKDGYVISPTLQEYQLSFTGHSLGAWLAELSVWHCKDEKTIGLDVHAVTFDSPGSETMLLKLSQNRLNAGILNIITYFSKPNIVNTCNPHVGNLRQVISEVSDDPDHWDWLRYSLDQHGIDGIVNAFDPQTGLPRNQLQVEYWPSNGAESAEALMEALPTLGEAASSLSQAVVTAFATGNPWVIFKPVGSLGVGAYNTYDVLSEYHFANYFANMEKYQPGSKISHIDKFYQHYNVHYKVVPFDARKLLLQNFHPVVGKFLKDFLEVRQSFKSSLTIPEETWQYLNSYNIIEDDHRSETWIVISVDEITVYEFRKQITKLVASEESENSLLGLFEAMESLRTGKYPQQETITVDWNLPDRNSDFSGRETVLKLLETNLKSTKISVVPQSITGLSGTGKSQLAAEYAYRARDRKRYQLVYWISAGNDMSLEYKKFARALQINTENFELPEVIMAVNHELATYTKTLLIFDGVKNYDAIKLYLPTQQVQGQIHIIITSQNQLEFGHRFQNIPLSEFSPDEAIGYVRNVLQKMAAEQLEENAEQYRIELATTMGYLPLALSQALAYIEQKDTTIKSYLAIYRTHKKNLLNSPAFKDDYNKQTVYRTWSISIETIRIEAPQALNLLNFCAYLSPNTIPKTLLRKMMVSEFELDEAIMWLRRYSLIQATDDKQSFRIHSLLQEVIKLHWQVEESKSSENDMPTMEMQCPRYFVTESQLPENNIMLYTREDIITKGLLWIYDLLPPFDDTKYFENLSKLPLLQHAESLIGHASEHTDSLNTIVNLQAGVISYQLSLDLNCKQEIDLLQQTLIMLKQVHGKIPHPHVGLILLLTGLVWSVSGNLQKAKTYLEQALVIQKQVCNEMPDQYLTLTLHNLGTVTHLLGEPQKAREYLEQELLLTKQLGGPTNYNTAYNLCQQGILLRDLGELQKAKEYLEEALVMYKQVFGQTLNRHMARNLYELGVLSDALNEKQKAKEYYKRALDMQKQVFHQVPHEDVVSSLKHLGKVCQTLGEFQEARNHFEQALFIEKQASGENSHGVAEIYGLLGFLSNDLNDTLEARRYFAEALKMEKQLHGEISHPDIVKNLRVLALMSEPQKAREYLEQALDMQKQLYKEMTNSDVALTFQDLGLVWKHLGELQKSKDYYEQALAVYKQLHSHVSEDQKKSQENSDEFQKAVVVCLNSLGMLHSELGELQKAKDCFEQSLELQKQLHKEMINSHVAQTFQALAVIWERLGELQKSKDNYERALAIYKQLHLHVSKDLKKSPENLDELQKAIACLNSLGILHSKFGELHKAKDYLEQALDMQEQQLEHSEASQSKARILHNLGLAWAQLNELQKAKECYEQALNIWKLVNNETPHLSMANNLYSLGEIYYVQGKLDQAKKYFEQALIIQKQIYKKLPHPDLAYSLYRLGIVWYNLRDYPKALDCIKRALDIVNTIPGKQHQQEREDILLRIIQFNKNPEQFLKKLEISPNNTLTSDASRLTPLWFSPVNIFSAIRQGYQLVQNYFGGYSSATSEGSIHARPVVLNSDTSEQSLKQPVLVDSASDYLMGPAKILFGIPNTTLAEHAAIINSHSGENSTQEQQLIQHTNRTLSFGEKLIVGQYVAHYVRKYSPFTLPWNRKHILSDSQKENLENYQKQIPIFKEIVALHKINPICQTDLFEDKFTFINKTLTKLGRDIRKALKSNKITDTVFADIQNRMNRVEEVIREIAKQIGRPDTAITKRNMVSADLAQETVRRTLPNSNETSEFVMVDPTERFALQFSVMQQFWKQPDVVTHKFQELIVEDNKNTTLQLDN